MKTNTYILLLSLLFSVTLFSCKTEKGTDLSLLQINIWHEGATVPGGVQGVIDIIDQLDPDVVFLCEIRNHNEELFIKKLVSSLAEKGKTYFGTSLDLSVGILSKYELKNPLSPFTLENKSRPMIKASIEVEGQEIVLYSAHLDYTHYECYLPRGYSGTTWKKIEAPVTDVDFILEQNRISYRDEAIAAFLIDAKTETDKGNIVLLGGDFNEPSHLDWQENTKHLWDHNGVVVDWDCSVMLHNAGYIDTYREKHPDASRYPGFTFPSANPDAELSKLAWAPDVDERDRIDFIYYYPGETISLNEVSIVGPSGTILHGQPAEKDTSDDFINPVGIWPTDHKAMFAIFQIKP